MIAVTGANGLLGSFLVRRLLAQQEPFVAIARKDSDRSLLADVADKVTWREADVRDEVALAEALQGVTHVIHAAAIVSFSPRFARNMMDINIEGTRNVVDICLHLGIRRLVHISSVAALGRQKGQDRIDESNKWVSDTTSSRYAESKYYAELEIFRGQEEGLSTVIVNPSVILAPADWYKSSAKVFKYIWDQKPFYTEGYINYVDVRDVAAIAVELLHQPIEGERFIANAGNISFENLFQKIAANFNKKAPSIKLNKTLLNVVARIEGIRSFLTGSEPLITRETARKAGTKFLFENDKIRKTLSFEFQPIDASLQWCCQYYMAKTAGKK